ncbi:phenylalanine and histidine ammonia-lyase [Xylaria sp. FL0064]|nr:phenylalanine and histidine ammonia-lyase [Xylaria sp. FL0064]
MMHHTELVLSAWKHVRNRASGQDSKPILLSGRDLTVADVVSIARHHARTDLSCSTLQSMEQSRLTLSNMLRGGDVIYGVNTNFGGSADLRTNKCIELQQALIRELHYGVLPPGERDHRTALQEAPSSEHRYDLLLESGYDVSYIPWSWARAAIAIRINSLVNGYSAVRPVVVERMRDLLQHDIIPMVPLRGSISASGDLSPLSYICGTIQGKPTIRVLSRDSNMMYADAALANAGLKPVSLEAKEGLASKYLYKPLHPPLPLTNGTSVSAAAAALALYDTHSLAIFAQILTAMTVEALNGTTESFHPFFSQARPHLGQVECARNILSLLAGSKLTKVNTGANSTLRQDRYSIRTVPQWIGPILEDLVLAHQQVSIECNSVTDNPLITPEGQCLHGGNFQAKSVTSAMEKARQATQGIGRMLFSQCTELINPATSRGLPPNLVGDDPTASLVFKGTDIYIAALTAELGFLANPVNHVQTAEMGNQSLNSLALISARYTHTANEVLSQLTALHLITVCQALDLRAMHIQFLELYEPQFRELVAKHYMPIEHSKLSSSAPDSATSNGILNNVTPEHTAERSNAKLNEPFGHTVKSLWDELLILLESTASMGPLERFDFVAKSLRPSILDNSTFARDPKLVSSLESFTTALSISLRDVWCTNRDVYLAHGDATHVLGKASKAVYSFLRHTLKVPMLSTMRIMTPTAEDVETQVGLHSIQAPTVGSYTGAVARALRDGTVVEAVLGLLESRETSDSTVSLRYYD